MHHEKDEQTSCHQLPKTWQLVSNEQAVRVEINLANYVTNTVITHQLLTSKYSTTH